MTKKVDTAPAKAALDEKIYPDNLPMTLYEIHDKFVGSKVLMVGDHPHADRVGMIDRMELAGAIRKWGFIVRFENDQYDEAFLFDAKHIHVIEKSKAPESKNPEKYKTRKFEIYGKTRIVRDIKTDEPKEFLAYYAGYEIYVQLDSNGSCLAHCIHRDGGYIVDGIFSHDDRRPYSIEEGIKTCLEKYILRIEKLKFWN